MAELNVPAVRVQGVRVLVVEDDGDQRRLVADILRSRRYLVTEAESLAAARRALAAAPVDLVLADWKLPDGDGVELLGEVRAGWPPAAFVVVTAYGTIARAVDAIRAGADDYLAKPFERQALLLALEKALRSRRLADENRRLSEELAARDRLVDLVGRAPSIARLFRQVEKLAATDATVLLTGESGTGKELAARALHALSRRANGEFVAVNCAALPETLVESELFGAEKGAYTGADRTRAGKFEAAHEGTLFLDEVGELPLAVQPKLLRALQEGRLTRLGGHREIVTDVRLIAATNRDLPAEVAAGRFREDLYYRLNVVPLRMPPLRERREDVPLLVEHFAARAARRHGVSVEAFPPRVLKRLLDHGWPGNVRELANVVERLVLLSEGGRVSEDDLPKEMTAPAAGSDGGFRLPARGLSWDDHERSCLAQALEAAAGNRARAARLLDLPYKAFLYRLEKHGLADA
ncbi:MAG TPA: sigma-54 dependent transcriptional regulator [Thermoanaerobaculia bacterium]